jgi:hypothetical protein
MLEFKKYFEEIDINLDYELSKIRRNDRGAGRGVLGVGSGIFNTIFKKGACGGKSCSIRSPGEVGWNYDDDDELEVAKKNYKPIKIVPEIVLGLKCYYAIKNAEENIVLEIPIKNKEISEAEIKNYNFYIEKNKNQIFTQIWPGRTNLDAQIKYKKHMIFNSKLIIEYQLLST